MYSRFADAMVKTGHEIQNNRKTLTDNGAISYKTSGKELLDLNFKIPELRHLPELDLTLSWRMAYEHDPVIALRWLFYLRDIRGGLGERRSFNVMFKSLDPKLQKELISYRVDFGEEKSSLNVPIIPHYGRWKDLFQYFAEAPEEVQQTILETMKFQLGLDLRGITEGRGISFMGKYLPSTSANNSTRRHNARVFAKYLGMKQRDYQEMVSVMLTYLHVPEQAMSRREWSSIDFQRVPSAAMRIYKNAFRRHDEERFTQYLESIKKGEKKVHAATLYPYQLISDIFSVSDQTDRDLIEQQWKDLPPFIVDGRQVLVVMDGSGSMLGGWGNGPIKGNSKVSCWDIAASITIMASESLKGPFKDKFITFSSYPQVVDMSVCKSLSEKVALLRRYDDCSNTDIQKTMRLILGIAIENHLKQEELPDDIVIISDMQFDCATTNFSRYDDTLFEQIIAQFKRYGYTMPRVTFWNVSAMNKTIPLQRSPGGVVLVSGFSTNNYKLIATGELDPYEALKATVMDSRYDPVEQAYNIYCSKNQIQSKKASKVPVQRVKKKDSRKVAAKALQSIIKQ